MLRASTIALALVCLFASACERDRSSEAVPAEARDRQPFTILATGDNRGKIAPCGCEPAVGGLSRRVAVVQERRAEGPVLVLDAGDALAADGRPDAERARLILKAMAATGIDAAAVGEIDLALGWEWLRDEAAKAGVPYLAANLRQESGEALFPGRKIVEVGGNRVGIFAVLTSGRRLPDGLVIEDAQKAATAEVEALRAEKVDMIVGLVHGPMREVNRIARTSDADLLIPGHQGGNTAVYQNGRAWVAYTGNEGRSLLEAKIDLRGEGKLVSTNVLENLRAREADLEKKIAAGKEKLESLSPSPLREEVESLVTRFTSEIERVRKERELVGEDGGRTIRSRFLMLGAEVGEDAAFLEEVHRLEPPEQG